MGRAMGARPGGAWAGGGKGRAQWVGTVGVGGAESAHKRLGVPRIKVYFWLMHKRCVASYNHNEMTEKNIHSETYICSREAAGPTAYLGGGRAGGTKCV